jgi:Glycosyl hydrolase family 9/Cellulase N-terminal ig-like domain
MGNLKTAVVVVAGALLFAAGMLADEAKVLTNHVGYELAGPKRAVVQGKAGDTVSNCALKRDGSDETVLALELKLAGPVKKWKDWTFWTTEFDAFQTEGKYYIACTTAHGPVRSYPFMIEPLALEHHTLSDAIYFLKEKRSSGQFDKADRHLPFDGKKKGTLDAHGGWWDATGDYGKHLSHLSFSTYFNPQQVPLSAYSLMKSYELLDRSGVADYARYKTRLLDEAMFGADYLVRVKAPAGSFYRSIATGGVKQVPEERKVAGEMKSFGIYQSNTQKPSGMVEQASNDMEYEVSYRSGGGVAIAALAMASRYPVSGEFASADYLRAAEEAFAYLEQNNLKMVNDGMENIVDDYCALTAATELYKATKKEQYKAAADRRAKSLVARLVADGPFPNYWRADDGTRPFFHASDAGFPVVSLLYYVEIADAATKKEVLGAVKKSLQHELAVTGEVNNPFGYGRQFVQDKSGNRHTTFFFPHNSDAAPWWQGENARLASLAAAARLAQPRFKDDMEFSKQLDAYGANQLNWILGLNPYDSCMMYGVGHNNVDYLFFDSWEFTNAPGGISNGITSGFRDEDDIDFNLTYKQTGADNDWRWQEQWLPHNAWYLLAVSAQGGDAKQPQGK